MAKKKHVWANPQQLIPSTRKQALKIMSDTKKVKSILELTESIAKATKELPDMFDDLSAWGAFALSRMSDSLLKTHKEFVNEFNDLLLSYELKDIENKNAENDNEEDYT